MEFTQRSKCSFDEFVGEKVVSLSCSSALLGLPLEGEEAYAVLGYPRLQNH